MIKVRLSLKRSAPRSRALIIWNVVLSVLISLGISLPTAAITRAQLEFYAQNGIFFYNPDNTVGLNSTTCISGSNTTGTGGRVLEQSQLDFVEKFKPIYQAAADKYNFPWQILVALQYRESGLNLNSPNTDGIYQIVGSSYPTGVVDEDEFARQTEDAAAFVSNIITNNNLNISNASDIKKIFLIYNSGPGGLNNSHFKELAVQYGYSADEPWEGSAYVMNKFDAAREQMLGGYKGKDGSWITYTDNRFGTYTVYTALGGSGNDGCFFAVAGGYYLAFGASGMSEDEAVRFMATFRDRMHLDEDPNQAGYAQKLEDHNDQLLQEYGFTYLPGGRKRTCTEGIAYNCVSFSRYFVNFYTEQASNKIYAGLGNGINVASGLTNGDYPAFRSCGAEAFAVFSGEGSGAAGHTGVILGINTNAGPKGEVITGEAACGSGEDGIKVVVYSLDEFTRRYNTFACAVKGVNLSVDDGYVFQFPEYNAAHPIDVIHIGT